MAPLRIAVFLPTLAGGGAERAMLHLARAFRDEGHEVDVVVNFAEGAYAASVPRGVGLVALHASGLPSLVIRLRSYLRRRRPERLFSAIDDVNVAVILAARLAHARAPIVVGIHNTWSQLLAAERGLRVKMIRYLASRLYPIANAVVTVSDGAADDAAVVLNLARDRVHVIPNPVLTPELRQLAAAEVDHPWFAPGAPPVVLACGRLTAQKDYGTLLHAFARLRSTRPCRLLILGEGEERATLERMAAELGIAADVELPGFTANPYALMARCAVYALSSRFEGSPVVLVEALACGCRIVATDCPSGPSETLRNVPGTRLVPVGDVAALAQAMAAFLGESTPPPGSRWLARFDYMSAAAAYMAVAA